MRRSEKIYHDLTESNEFVELLDECRQYGKHAYYDYSGLD